MNHRVVIAGSPRLSEAARGQLVGALAEITGLGAEVFEERLALEPAWLLDLPSDAEARRLCDWAFTALGARTSIVPAVGAVAPSRAAGLAFLEAQVAEAQRRRQSELAAEDAERLRRQQQNQEKARSLASEPAATPSTRDTRGRNPAAPSSAHGERDALELRVPSVGSREAPGDASVERPHTDLALRPERKLPLQVVAGLGLLLALVFAVGPFVVGFIARGRVEDHLRVALLALADVPVLDERIARQAVASVVRNGGDEPEAWELTVFVAEDRLAIGLEADRGYALRTPEDGVRVRARAAGDRSFMGRSVHIDAYVDVLLPTARLKARVEPYWGDFVRLDAP